MATRRKKDLECPFCHSRGKVQKPQPQPQSPYPAQYTLHGYRCLECLGDYTTEERVVDAGPNIIVRGEASSRFSLQRFVDDLKADAPKRMRIASDYDLIKAHVITSITVAGATRPRPSWLGIDDQGFLLISRKDIARLTRGAFVEVARHYRHTNPALAARLDVGHIQYTLATQGRSWTTARDFLEWFRAVDHQQRRAGDLEPQWTPQDVTWGVPSMPPELPIKMVVTNKFVENVEPRTRATQPFSPAKLSTNLTRAFRGLPHGQSMAANVDMYVRWCLIGQQIVRTSQISTLISEALRAVHDIAYLRWVIAGKELTPDTVFDEAVSLLTYPSPRLHFVVNSSTLVRAALSTPS